MRVGGAPVEACKQVEESVFGLVPYGEASGSDRRPKGRAVRDNFVNRVVDMCGGAIVRVDTEQQVDDSGEDLFAVLFGLRPEVRERKRRGHGSGFCIDPAGVILTNAHVVRGADRVTVTFAGTQSPMQVEVLEEDEVLDVAALKVKSYSGKPLPCLRLGSSQTLKTGDWAIVLGNPLGLNNTCTLGIVSSLDRSAGEAGLDWIRHPMVQTDAAVNQGNSGGPLLNENGEVVGIISMRAMFGEGIGFAIPVDSVSVCLPALLQRRKMPRAYLGLKMATLTPDVCEASGLSIGTEGALVERVLAQSPAEAAGVVAGDIVLEIDRSRVRRVDQVQGAVLRAKVGAKVALKVQRSGKVISLDLKTEDVAQVRAKAEAAAQRARGASGGAPHRIIIMR